MPPEIARGRRRFAARGLAAVVAGVGVGLALGLAGCDRALPPSADVPGGDAEHGRDLLAVYGCRSCHQIPGVVGGETFIGPPLAGLRGRRFIAGRLPLSADNLVRWILEPDEVDPGTAMPDLRVSPAEARDMAAYLLTVE